MTMPSMDVYHWQASELPTRGIPREAWRRPTPLLSHRNQIMTADPRPEVANNDLQARGRNFGPATPTFRGLA